MLGSLILWPVEHLLNQLIQRDSYLRDKVAVFNGKTIAVHSHSPNLNLTLQIDADGLQLSAHDADTLGIAPDAGIAGKLVDLLGLLTADASRKALVNEKIQISGDASLVQDLYLTSKQLDIDWQDYLAPLLGDALTHEVGKFQQRSAEVVADSAQRMKRNVESYLKDERQLLPHEEDVARFMDGLDTLRLQTDRLNARIAALEASLDAEPKQVSD